MMLERLDDKASNYKVVVVFSVIQNNI